MIGRICYTSTEHETLGLAGSGTMLSLKQPVPHIYGSTRSWDCPTYMDRQTGRLIGE